MTTTWVRQSVLILVLLVAATVCIAAFGLDLTLARYFYRPGEGFYLGNEQPWQFLYRHGERPAYLIGITALLVYLASFVTTRMVRYRLAALFLALSLVIGPGLVVNSLLKGEWGRPRPRHLVELGGTMQFHQPWQPGPVPRNASFPAGHPAAAFYFSAPYFLLRKSRPIQARWWLYSGALFGIMMGIARIVQGGHFLSDVVWSAGLVYLTMLILAALLRLDERLDDGKTPLKNDVAG